MEPVVRHFGSFEEAEAADIEQDLAMTPEQRIAMVLELQARFYPDADQQGFARVYRLTQRQPSSISSGGGMVYPPPGSPGRTVDSLYGAFRPFREGVQSILARSRTKPSCEK